MATAMHPPPGAACLPIIVVDHGHAPLGMLLAPLLASPYRYLGSPPYFAGRETFGRLIAGGIRGGDVVKLLGGVPKIIIVSTPSDPVGEPEV
jgi:hypothetical protein